MLCCGQILLHVRLRYIIDLTPPAGLCSGWPATSFSEGQPLKQPDFTLLDEALGALDVLCCRGGIRLDDADRAILRRRIPSPITWLGGTRQSASGELSLAEQISCAALTVAESTRASQIFSAVYLGIYDAAADGVALTDVNEVARWYHASVRDNYPEAGRAFLRFATTYWTFKVILRRLDLEHRDMLLRSIFQRADELIAPLFFPQDGPLKIDPKQREDDQRRFLTTFGPRVDVKEFLLRNPILMRDRQDLGQTRSVDSAHSADPPRRTSAHSFLYLHGANLVQLILLLSIVTNVAAAVRFFTSSAPALGLWALAASVLLPRAVFALFLISERNGGLYRNLSPLLTSLYRRTLVQYQPMNYDTYFSRGLASAYVRESLKLCLWFVPSVLFLNGV
jgi:hypothetical protein